MLCVNKCVCLFLLCLLSHIAKAQIELPDSLLTSLQKQHPRLLVKTLKGFDEIKNQIPNEPYLVKCRANILNDAESFINAPVCTYSKPDGLTLLEMSRTVMRRAYILSMAYRLTCKKKYADRLYKDLLAASLFPDWNPYVFLDVAEMTHAFAIGYDWLFDVWTTDQKKVIRQAIIEKGLLKALLYYEGLVTEKGRIVDFPKSVSNWNSVCNSGMCIGALAIAEDEPLLAEKILRHALKSIPLALQAYAPDGGFAEGLTYWSYAMRYNVALMASLESALGTDFGLSKSPGLSVTGNFPIAMSGSTGYPFQYSDAWNDVIKNPVFFWLAKKYHNPLYLDYIKSVSDKSVLDLLWYSNQTGKISLPLNYYFKKVNVGYLRSAWNDKNAWYVGIKGGNNQDSHSHLDLGSFIVERNNIRWFTDLGVDNYSLDGYFDKSKKRWTYYRIRAEGHNTLVINPDNSPDQNLFAGAPIVTLNSTNYKSFAIIDLKDAYGGKLSSAQRGLALINKKQVLIQDEVAADKPFELYWFAHTPAKITLSDNGKIAHLHMKGKGLAVKILSPADAIFEVMAPELLPTSIPSVGNNKNEGTKKLAIHLKDIKKTTIAVSILEEGTKVETAVSQLKEW